MRARSPLAIAALLSTLVACGDSGSGGSPNTGGSPGTGGSGAGTTSEGGSGGSSSSQLPSGGAGGTVETGGTPAAGPTCAANSFALCEDFEGADDGGFPVNWGPRGDEWGGGQLGVASDDARFGTKSLKADGANNGQHFMDFKGDLAGLASHHYGRVYMKVAVPAPWPSSGVLHADFIEGLGPGPGGSTHNVRWGIVANTSMKYQWIYNVQPSNGAPEFAEGTSYDYDWSGQWQCIQWMYDEPTQDGTLWIDGVELPIQPGENHPAELPVFSSLGVGLANYQDAGAGYTVWFDELAYDPNMIPCQ
ncbi:MAG: hypothetical protein JNK04_19420 [Myxococcales bacterium]|nr:hypothetical protein [Myxococcales bacterium]